MACCSSCSRAPCSCVPSSAPGVCPPGRGPDFAPAPGNTPPEISYLACTPALAAQPGIDIARKQAHILGYRPYRVRLVWQVQDEYTHTWSEDASLELMPVEIRDFDSVELLVEKCARKPDGVVNLREVSLAQVDEATLRGFRNGEAWGDDTARREFFYEVQQIPACPGDRVPRAYRFVLAGAPTLRLDRNEWQVRITTQFGHRSKELIDQTVPDDGFGGAALLA